MEPKTLNVTYGKPAQLLCTTDSSYPRGVEWEFSRNGPSSRLKICDATDVHPDVVGKYKCTNQLTTHELIINDAVFNDSGVYTCTEDGGRGRSNSAHLFVVGG